MDIEEALYDYESQKSELTRILARRISARDYTFKDCKPFVLIHGANVLTISQTNYFGV